MTGRRVTPTGVLVYSGAPHSDQWFQARREGITATDIPKILGISPYGTALDVWADKRGLVQPEPAGEAAYWGTQLEDIVAKHWAQVNGRRIRKIGIVANCAQPWMRASCDRKVEGDMNPIPGEVAWDDCRHDESALEVKCRSSYKADEWRDDDVPDDVRAQGAWQMACTGYDIVHVACLLGGNTFIQRTLRFDPDLDEYIQTEARKVWQHIQDGTEPAVAPSALTLSLWERLYPNPEGDVEVNDPIIPAWRDYYAATGKRIEELKKAREQAKAAMVGALRGKQRALINGQPAYTFKASTRKAYTVAESTTHTFRLAKESA